MAAASYNQFGPGSVGCFPSLYGQAAQNYSSAAGSTTKCSPSQQQQDSSATAAANFFR